MIKQVLKKAKNIAYDVVGHYPVQIGDEYFKGNVRHRGFWKRVNLGKWEPETIQILKKYLSKTDTFCDIGAWIGPTSLYASRKCNKVLSFEPDFVAYEALLQNIRLNDIKNIIPFNFLLGNSNGFEKIASFGSTLGDSMTSVLNRRDGKAIDVPSLTWPTVLDIFSLDKIDFVKMDIEGAEFEVINSFKYFLRDARPILYLSTHPHRLPPADRESKMLILKDVLSVYPKIYDAHLNEISWDIFLSEKNINNGNEFLFLNS